MISDQTATRAWRHHEPARRVWALAGKARVRSDGGTADLIARLSSIRTQHPARK